MAGSYVSNRLAELAPCLDGPEGQEAARLLGTPQDAEAGLLRASALVRLPHVCPADALDCVGSWLKVQRFRGEQDGVAPLGDTPGWGYRGRLCAAWRMWSIAASAAAIEASLRAYGISNVRVLEEHEGRFWPGDWYSRFRVVIGPFAEDEELGTSPAEIDYTLVIDESLIGSTYGQRERAQIVSQLLKWKSAHSYCVDVVILFSPLATMIDVNFVIDGSVIADDDDAFSARWHVGPLIDVDFVIDVNTIGGYVET